MIYDKGTKINYYDMNGRGDVKLTALLKHINLAAGANAEDMGAGLDVTIPLKLAFVIQRFGLRVFKWPVYGQNVRIRTWPAQIVKGTFVRNGDMWCENGKKMAEWTGLWVLIDIEARKVRRPKALPVDFEGHGPMDVSVEAEKIDVPDSVISAASYTHVVRFSEADINMHMNNAIYGDLIANVLNIAESPLSYVPSWQEVQFNYLSEAKIGEAVDVECKISEDIVYVTGSARGQKVFAASVKI